MPSGVPLRHPEGGAPTAGLALPWSRCVRRLQPSGPVAHQPHDGLARTLREDHDNPLGPGVPVKSRPILLAALFVGLPGVMTAQSGTVRYTETVPLDFKLPPNSPMAGRLPKSSTKAMQLTFSPEGARYTEAPRVE